MNLKQKAAAWVAAVAAAATVTVIGSSAPAEAATTRIKYGALCTWGGGYAGDPSFVAKCGSGTSNSSIKLTERPKYNGHRVVSVQFAHTKLCLDSLGNTKTNGQAVYTHACNDGDYQRFEVFYGSVAGTVVLKDLGAWTKQKTHICIQVQDEGKITFSYFFWNTCGTSVKYQQFKFA